MDSREVLRAFHDEVIPADGSLVVFDGFDELDKEAAVATFSARSADSILVLLRQGLLGNAFNALEELGVLEPAAIRYYIGPFLVRLAEVVGAICHYDEYIANVLFRLSEI